MTLQQRIEVLVQLGNYIKADTEEWNEVKDKAYRNNQWFTPEFIEVSSNNIASEFLQKDKLVQWISTYSLPEENQHVKTVGLVMGGYIPLVSFHDFLCIFITGNKTIIKPSAKDEILIKFLAGKMAEINEEVNCLVSFAERLKGCEVYIATASNNTEKYFEQYFSKYPNILHSNRTSVAILDGNETAEDLEKISDDIQMYFGLGATSVSKIYVPKEYDFKPLLVALEKYDHFSDFHKYKNNYDYQLALLMMGNKMYMTNGSILLAENKSVFSAVSQLHYEYYTDKSSLINELKNNKNVEHVVGKDLVSFGQAQYPGLTDYADVDTIRFLLSLK